MTSEPITVLIETGLGSMRVATYPAQAPASAAYFIDDVDRGVYADSAIFRIVTEGNRTRGDSPSIEVMQGGERPVDVAPSIAHESTQMTGITHRRGVISLARFRPGAVYHSFFICFRDEPSLDFGGRRHLDGQGFAAFGMLLQGWEVLERIRQQAEPGEFMERPIGMRVRRATGLE